MNRSLSVLILSALSFGLVACGGGGSESSATTGDAGDNGGTSDGPTVTVAVSGAGSVSQTSQTLSSGQDIKFTVTPDELMVTQGISSEACEFEVIGDDVYVSDVTTDCTINVTFDDCVNCYSKDDAVAMLDYNPYRELLARNCVINGLVVTGSENVPWHNLCQAAEMADAMLEYNTPMLDVMKSRGSIIALFGEGEGVCDLPYYDFIAGEPQCGTADGGLGGTTAHPVAACNAATLSATRDPFNRGRADGENVCVHEISHTIMIIGVEPYYYNEITNRYAEVLAAGNLWVRDNGENAFALQDEYEFFAELTQSYFNANVAVDSFNHTGVNGADELAEYDPVSFAIIESIYMQPADLK